MIAALVLLGSPTHSTVLEFDSSGKVTIIDRATSAPNPPANDPIDKNNLRALTRDIAIRYSGTAGVRKAGLDALTFVEVFSALIERESPFDPDAVSPKGAKGLGQLMPDTASDMGVNDPFDPVSNLTGSAQYFTALLAEFGSLDLALAAYNAGPERVRQQGGVPPFEETKTYIAWILKRAGIERQVTDPSGPVVPTGTDTVNQVPDRGVSVWEF